VKNSYPSSVK